jgi:hypothetical protein
MTPPAELIAVARQLVARTDAKTAGVWPRAAALLGRQAFESALDEWWRAKGIPLDVCTTHAQLLCLSTYLRDDDTAAQLGYAWSALTRACHHHPYELSPATGELEGWLFVIAEWLKEDF